MSLPMSWPSVVRFCTFVLWRALLILQFADLRKFVAPSDRTLSHNDPHAISRGVSRTSSDAQHQRRQRFCNLAFILVFHHNVHYTVGQAILRGRLRRSRKPGVVQRGHHQGQLPRRPYPLPRPDFFGHPHNLRPNVQPNSQLDCKHDHHPSSENLRIMCPML
jgi:hypothetical protein